MLGSLAAIYGGSKKHQGKGSDGSSFTYTSVKLLGTADKEDEVLAVTADNSIDFSKLDRFKEYLFEVDITTQDKGKRVKIVGVSPFAEKGGNK